MKIIIIFLISILIVSLYSLDVPKLKGRINDYANILSDQEENDLETILYTNESATSAEIVLLTIPSLKGDNLENYSMKVVEKWKLGKKNSDNGVLVFVALQDRKIRIEVGYGLESVLTDIVCGFIIRNYTIDYFRNGNYYAGIKSGLQAITGIISKEIELDPTELEKYQQTIQNKNKSGNIFSMIAFLVFMLFVGLIPRSRRRGGLLPYIFLGSAMGNFSGRGSSSGGFGGFSGGGGGFGGGGASGGW